jgi:hypothetical protein
MKLSWITFILVTSIILMAILKTHEQRQFRPFFKAEPVIKLQSFSNAKTEVSREELDLLELWESMLTGRTAPVARWIKDKYKSLGLNHLFTPSGFHLSAVLLPVMKLIKSSRWQLITLLLLTMGIFTLQGQGALKRMALVKLNQRWLNQKTGFLLALLLDMLWGSFIDSPLSFTYSFLFLGLIYSGNRWLFLWFFLGQALIAYFQGELISPLILLFSPVLNLIFALAMPMLVLLAIPLWDWQLSLGLKLLKGLNYLVVGSAEMSSWLPPLEPNVGVIILLIMIIKNKRRWLPVGLLLLSTHLNSSSTKIPSFGNYEFVPHGEIIKRVLNEKGEVIYYSDGKCKRELIRGVWWEKCSPKRRSTRKKKN